MDFFVRLKKNKTHPQATDVRFCLHTTKTETLSSLEPKWNPKGPLLALPCGIGGEIRDPG